MRIVGGFVAIDQEVVAASDDVNLSCEMPANGLNAEPVVRRQFEQWIAVIGIMSPRQPGIPKRKKSDITPGFLAKSITCSGQITTINQSLPNFSRATE
jgi:hypothetical protein